jgi:hypothetical protein
MFSCQNTNKEPNKTEGKKPISVERVNNKLKINFDDGTYELFCPKSEGSDTYYPCPIA